VVWHLANPPAHEGEAPGFADDDAALDAAAAIGAED
jgi:hypothetical protein